VNVPSGQEAASKYSRRASQAGGDYTSGVESSSDQEQEQETLNAQDRWEQGVQESIQEGSWARGVQESPKSWQENALELGPARYTSGVQQAEGTYAQSVEPFFSTLESLTLDARGPRGSPENYDRSRQVGQALNEERVSR